MCEHVHASVSRCGGQRATDFVALVSSRNQTQAARLARLAIPPALSRSLFGILISLVPRQQMVIDLLSKSGELLQKEHSDSSSAKLGRKKKMTLKTKPNRSLFAVLFFLQAQLTLSVAHSIVFMVHRLALAGSGAGPGDSDFLIPCSSIVLLRTQVLTSSTAAPLPPTPLCFP